jgi:hypothetical protein
MKQINLRAGGIRVGILPHCGLGNVFRLLNLRSGFDVHVYDWRHTFVRLV